MDFRGIFDDEQDVKLIRNMDHFSLIKFLVVNMKERAINFKNQESIKSTNIQNVERLEHSYQLLIEERNQMTLLLNDRDITIKRLENILQT